MDKRVVGAALAAVFVLLGAATAVLYQNPIYFFLFGGPGLVLLAAIALMGRPSQGPQS